MLQAAVVQLAPNRYLEPCSSPCCCWRWAAQEILEEHEEASKTGERLRSALQEEWNKNAPLQLAELRQIHQALETRLEMAIAELSSLRDKLAASEAAQEELLDAKCKANTALEESEQQRLRMEEMLESRCSQLEAQLRKALDKPGVVELEKTLAGELAKATEMERQHCRLEEELNDVKMQRTDLEWDLRQSRVKMAALEQWKRRRLRCCKARKTNERNQVQRLARAGG